MRKIWVIASREYRVAVRSKAFVITMILMPVLMLGSLGAQVLFKKLEGGKEKKYVVIDRTGGVLAKVLEVGVDRLNEAQSHDPEARSFAASKIVFEHVTPSEDEPQAIARQRFELSQKVERDEIEGIIEIGPRVLAVRGEMSTDNVPDDAAVRFQSKKPNQQLVMGLISQTLNAGAQAYRFAAKKISPEEVREIQEPIALKHRALTKQTADGGYADVSEGLQIANFVLPAVLIGLMFMVIMVGATPAMQGIVEEKSQRIAEVLLGSVTPFQLMAGKLLGLIGVSLTMATVYLVGGYVIAERAGVAEMMSPGLLAWFFVFLVLALLSFGSLFIAVGAASGDIKDTQTLLMPIMVIACLPFFALGPIMQDPNGKIAVVCSFFPFATPMLLVARQSVPPGVPLVQLISGIILVLLTTFVCVWAAGRIFRIGILMQGKAPRVRDLVRWVIRG
jgi:ABC-2 type transport system permease protein